MTNAMKLVGLLACPALLGAALILDGGGSGGGGDAPAESEPVVVQLCDGETEVAVEKHGPLTREDGRRIAGELMARWMRKNEGRWEVQEQEVPHKIVPPHDNRGLLASGGQGGGHVYGSFTERDILMWEREVRRLVVEGARVFHDAEALGSTIAVSCDMCHPDASNTHPETYPKFQTQIGKVVLLRDMINWCVEHPLRGKKLDPDGPRMRALEAYILAQRKGERLAYGKH